MLHYCISIFQVMLAKLQTHADGAVLAYIHNKTPLFFELDKEPISTLLHYGVTSTYTRLRAPIKCMLLSR